MKKNYYLKKFVFIVLLLVTICLISYGSSSAKYSDSGNINYNVNFMSMKTAEEIKPQFLDTSTTTKLRYRVKFNSNSSHIKSTDHADYYTLYLGKSSCRVDSVKVNNEIYINVLEEIASDGVNYQYRVQFGPDLADSKSIEYDVSCDVSNALNAEQTALVVPMTIYETIDYGNSKNRIFTFATPQFSMEKTTYDNAVYHEPPEGMDENNPPTTYTTNSYSKLVAWLELYARKNNFVNPRDMEDYLNTFSINGENDTIVIADTTNFNSNSGLTVTGSNGSFTFTIQNVFASYVNTYTGSKNVSSDKKFYFNNITDIDNTFYNYLRKYLSYDEEKINVIKTEFDRVKSSVGVSNILEIFTKGYGDSLSYVKYNSSDNSLVVPKNLYELASKAQNTSTTFDIERGVDDVGLNIDSMRSKMNVFISTYIENISSKLGSIWEGSYDGILSEIVGRSIDDNSSFKLFDSYLAIADNDVDKKILIHIHTTDASLNTPPGKIIVDINVTTANIQNLNYNLVNSNNSDEKILNDLDYISQNINSRTVTVDGEEAIEYINLVFKDNSGNNIAKPTTLEIGQTYKSNIGEITVSGDGTTNKIITIDFSKKS